MLSKKEQRLEDKTSKNRENPRVESGGGRRAGLPEEKTTSSRNVLAPASEQAALFNKTRFLSLKNSQLHKTMEMEPVQREWET